MLTTAIVTYFHFVSIILLFVALTVEKILFKQSIDQKTARRILVFDSLYGIAALILLTTGLLKFFLYGKGSGYYIHNYLMWIKLALFSIVGILSIYPTVYFLKWRKILKRDEEVVISEEAYKKISLLIHLELAIAILIPLLATLLARGFGV